MRAAGGGTRHGGGTPAAFSLHCLLCPEPLKPADQSDLVASLKEGRGGKASYETAVPKPSGGKGRGGGGSEKKKELFSCFRRERGKPAPDPLPFPSVSKSGVEGKVRSDRNSVIFFFFVPFIATD